MTTILDHQSAAKPTDRLAKLDFELHNEETRRVVSAYYDRQPIRVPIQVGTNTRYFMFSPDANDVGMDFRRYSEDPDVMFDTMLRFARWSRYNLLQDNELGLPEKWWVGIDFQNYYEAAWFGCPIQYMNDQVPDTTPAFAECPEKVMENGLPDPFGGLFGRGLEYYEHMSERAKNEEFYGRPVSVGMPGGGTDGPMTVACNLFSPEFVCTAMVEEPDLLQTLLTFITDATIERLTAWKTKAGVAFPQDGFWMADDSVALISTSMLCEHILPHHRRLYDTFGTSVERGLHLCGNATRHFPTLIRELGIAAFDTGFPVDFGALREAVGPDVRIHGGPHIELMRSGTTAKVYEECQRILQTGILKGRMFLLREGNNLAPGTPLENIEAMVHAGLDFGSFEEVSHD
ncbi:MAG: uroporphyrinogen decarboxylase family protein [Fimbriimonas sp.]|nr:uroporphyrinogen decarboxylase family protein [Fimbriimonas sp.]